jgi:SAM-dependent methyltransferase
VYERSAHVYDEIYGAKDYEGEAARIHDLIQARNPGARTLLDVACGTGRHLEHLRAWYEVEGLDREPTLLAVARERLPEVPLHEGDMRDFDLVKRFDAVTCLFSAIGHVASTGELHAAVRVMANHLADGGVLVVEPWLTPDKWIDRFASADAHGRVARASRSRSEDRTTHLEFHYAVASPEGFQCWTEQLESTLFTVDEYLDAFRAARLAVEHDADGLIGRGLYLGVRD